MTRVRHSSGRRRRKHDDHINHEAWAIPYGDLVTLLLAFFVVMYAISSVNAGKYRVLSDSLFAAFHGAPRTMQPIQVGDKQVGTGADMNSTLIQQAQIEGKEQSRIAPVPVAAGASRSRGNSPIDAGRLPAQAAAAAQALSKVADEVAKAMDQLVSRNQVTIRRSDFWIEVEMRTDILFPSGSARLADDAIPIIERLGTVLAPFPNPIRVEGHTDDKPIKTAIFSSNWELSAARAGSVVRVLSTHGVAPGRLAVIGYGEQRPSKTNDTAEGRNANRRVVIVILSTELMRQQDPIQPGQLQPGQFQPDSPQPAVAADGGATAAPATALPVNTAPVINSPPVEPGAGSGAIATPLETPQATPAPRPADPAATTARSAAGTGPGTTARLQLNTGTEPAP